MRRNLTMLVWILGSSLIPAAYGSTAPSAGGRGPAAETAKEVVDVDLAQSLIFDATNDYRSNKGLDALSENSELTEAARYFARYMAKTGQLSHTADGQSPAGRASQFGYQWSVIAENIAYQSTGFTNSTEGVADRFMRGWIASQGHRQNIEKSMVTDVGIAVAYDSASRSYFAVQLFGRPRY